MANTNNNNQDKSEENKQETKEPRPPIVVVVGHVDHGKTKLLDYIRKTSVAEKEAGGITQHIGAYEIVHSDKKITFIDTPGHEAFTQMRSRGIKAADIAVLVVAADDGVKPQTIESISRIKEAEIPFVVALNKTDKPEANPNKAKQELAEQGIMVEGWGGTVPVQEISALTGQGVDELLEMILLLAEMEELKAERSKPGSGVVIESHMDSRTGPTFTCLVTDGVMKVGDYIVAGSVRGKIKSLADFRGKPVKSITFSSPAAVNGLSGVPSVGEWCLSSETKKDMEETMKETQSEFKEEKEQIQEDEHGKKVLNVILKTDVFGLKEALEKSINDLKFKEVAIKITKSEVGDINESDVKAARNANTLIAGFKVKLSGVLARLAENFKIDIVQSDIIYELIEAIKNKMSELLEPIIERRDIGTLDVLAIFRQEKDRMIVGGKVIKGKVKQGALIEVMRDAKSLGKGKITHLQQEKKDADEVTVGNECGIKFLGSIKIQVGDKLEAYEEARIKRELEVE